MYIKHTVCSEYKIMYTYLHTHVHVCNLVHTHCETYIHSRKYNCVVNVNWNIMVLVTKDVCICCCYCICYQAHCTMYTRGWEGVHPRAFVMQTTTMTRITMIATTGTTTARTIVRASSLSFRGGLSSVWTNTTIS